MSRERGQRATSRLDGVETAMLLARHDLPEAVAL